MIWFFHGNLGSPSDWEAVTSHSLLRDIPTRIPSLPDLLPPPVPSLSTAGEYLANDTASEFPAPVLCGYSMGGRLAAHVFLSRPGFFRGLILIGAHLGLASEEEKKARFALDSKWGCKLAHLPWVDFCREWFAQPVFRKSKNHSRPEPDNKTRSFYAEAFTAWSTGVQDNLIPALSLLLEKSTTPVLLISGQEDIKFRSHYTEAQTKLPHSRHISIAGAGHRLPEDSPEELAAQISRFYQSLP